MTTHAEPSGPGTIPVEELRTLFLFEALDDDQLDWLVERGRVEFYPAGATVFTQSDPAEGFFVLLSGAVVMSRNVRGDEIEISRTGQRGVYAGATQAYVTDARRPSTYLASMRTLADSRLLVLPAEELGAALRGWFPMAMHLLEGMYVGLRNSDATVGQRERLMALGSLSAGLMHELNNPAAAAVRATATLRERVAAMRHKLALIAEGRIDPAQLRTLVDLQEAMVAKVAKAPTLTAMETSDREDELSDWLGSHGVDGGWDIAPVLVSAGLDVGCMEDVAASVEPPLLDQAVRWLTYALETEMLMGEIEDATLRMSTLVGAAKQYSQMDRAGHQWTNIHEGLKSTLAMLHHKIGDGVRVVKEFDRELPQIPAYPGELNPVWTNLIDNALAAMDGEGTLTVRTARDRDRLLVEIGDTGPGVPPDVREHIFEPFFTTKPVGEGTGLGLDISYRIVVNRHGGDIRLESRPGDTRFQVRLPISAPAPPGDGHRVA